MALREGLKMDEKAKEYRREWRRKNRDKVKQYEIEKAMRRVVEAIEAGRVEVVNKREIRAVGSILGQ
jgi:hypothetical protein